MSDPTPRQHPTSPPTEYGRQLSVIAAQEAAYGAEAEACAAVEHQAGRPRVADQWRLTASGHRLQCERYTALAAAYP